MKLYGGFFGRGVRTGRTGGTCIPDAVDEIVRERSAALEFLRLDLKQAEADAGDDWEAWSRRLSELDERLRRLDALTDEQPQANSAASAF